MDGNGGIEKKEEPKAEVKTPEQLLVERLERYQKNPADFVELSEVICMAVKNSTSQLGVSVMVGNVQRSLLDIGIVELNHIVNKIRLQMDIRSEMMNAGKGIITPNQPKHGIVNFIRGRK